MGQRAAIIELKAVDLNDAAGPPCRARWFRRDHARLGSSDRLHALPFPIFRAKNNAWFASADDVF